MSTKQKIEAQVLERLQPMMGPGEWLEGIVVAVGGPWQYLTFASLPVALILLVLGLPAFSLVALLAGIGCALAVRPRVLALTDQAVYAGRLTFGGNLDGLEVLTPLSDLDFARFFPLLRLGDERYWVTPTYLGEDADEFTRCCLGATGRGPAIVA